MRYWFIFIFLLSILNLKSQSVKWTKGFGSFDIDFSESIDVDSAGNVYVVGTYRDELRFEASSNVEALPFHGVLNSFFCKLDSSGEIVWAKKLGESNSDYAYVRSEEIYVNKNSIYVTGSYQSIVDFDLSENTFELNSYEDGRIFLAKYDLDGQLSWAKSFGGESNGTGYGYSVSGNSISVDLEGNVYLTGCFVEDADFDPGEGVDSLFVSGDQSAFISKFSSSGDYLWAKNINSIQQVFGDKLKIANDKVFLLAYYYDRVSMVSLGGQEEYNSNGERDFLLIELDLNGNYLTSQSFGGIGPDYIDDFQIDDENIYLYGSFKNDFRASKNQDILESRGKHDVFVLKLNADGIISWSKRIGSTDNELGSTLELTPTDDIVISGEFYASLVLDNIELNSNGISDIFLAVLDQNGETTTAYSFGSTSPESVQVSTIIDGNLIISGSYSESFDFNDLNNQRLQSLGYASDVFLAFFSSLEPKEIEHDSVITSSKTPIEEIEIFPNPVIDNLNLNLPETFENSKILLLSLEGKILREYPIKGDLQYSINLSFLNSGIYILLLKARDNIFRKKIVVR